MSVREFHRVLSVGFEEMFLWLVWEDVADAPHEDERWLNRHGVTIRWIPKAERPPRNRLFPKDRALRDLAARLPLAAPATSCACVDDHVAPVHVPQEAWARFPAPRPVSPGHPLRRIIHQVNRAL
jgi:hypothetical protein